MPTGFTKLFTDQLARLREAEPRIALELLTGARPVDLRKGEADLAIRVGPVQDEDLVARKLCDTGWSLYAAASYLARRPAPADPAELSGHDVIGYDASLATVPAAAWLDAHASGATVVLRSREMTDMLAAAASGVGLAVLPCALGDEEPALVRLTPQVLATREVWLVHAREARAAAALQAVMRFVVEVMRENAGRLLGAPRA
jgi:DNA-binding transcriptional LysR family regulator